MAELKALLQEQAEQLSKREGDVQHHLLLSSGAVLNYAKADAVSEEELEYLQLVKQARGSKEAIQRAMDSKGLGALQDVDVPSEHSPQVMLGIIRDNKYGKAMDKTLSCLATMLTNYDFRHKFIEILEYRVSLVLRELKQWAEEHGCLYLTECKAVEVAVECFKSSTPTAPKGTPERDIQNAARPLVMMLSLYQNYILDKGPLDNKRASATAFVEAFKTDFKPLMAEDGRHRVPSPECGLNDQQWHDFLLGLSHIANGTLVSGTMVARDGKTYKNLEQEVKAVFEQYVAWGRVQDSSIELAFMRKQRPCLEIEKMAYLLPHHSTNYYTNEGPSITVTKDARLKLSKLSYEELPPHPTPAPLDLQILDVTWKTGFHVLAGEGIRLWADTHKVTNDVSGKPFYHYFMEWREVSENIFLQECRDKMMRIVEEPYTAELQDPIAGMVKYKGTLYNLMIHHIRDHIQSTSRANLMESQEAFQRRFPSKSPEAPELQLGQILVSAGAMVASNYEDLYALMGMDISSTNDGTVHVANTADLSEGTIREKVAVGVILLYLACQQPGYRVGPNAVLKDLLTTYLDEIDNA